MINMLPIALVGILATAATSSPFIHKRQDGQQVVFRSDLKQGMGQSPEFKNVYLTHTATNATNTTGHYDITFVDQAEKANADHAVVASHGIPLGISANTTLYMNMGVDKANPRGPQPITLDTKQQSAGWFYTASGELKATSINWDTWLICEGDEGYPRLYWLGAVPMMVDGVLKLVVTEPQGCSAVRLFADSLSAGPVAPTTCQCPVG